MRRIRPTRLLFAALMLVTGCTSGSDTAPDASDPGDAGDPADACGAEPPSGLEACFVGDDFADCGGPADPAFGCRADGSDCRWLTGGCAPSGFVVSRCPPDDVCCRDDWPFPHDTFSAGFPGGNSRVYFDLYSKGPLPWDADRAARIEVRLEPELEPTRPDEAQCLEVPAEDYYYFCEEPVVYLDGATSGDDVQPDDTVSISFQYPGPSSDFLAVEVLPDGEGAHVARACIRPSNDATDGEPSCPGYFDAIDPSTADPAEGCAVDGVVRLSDVPEEGEGIEDLAGRIDVTFADGLRVRGGF